MAPPAWLPLDGPVRSLVCPFVPLLVDPLDVPPFPVAPFEAFAPFDAVLWLLVVFAPPPLPFGMFTDAWFWEPPVDFGSCWPAVEVLAVVEEPDLSLVALAVLPALALAVDPELVVVVADCDGADPAERALWVLALVCEALCSLFCALSCPVEDCVDCADWVDWDGVVLLASAVLPPALFPTSDDVEGDPVELLVDGVGVRLGSSLCPPLCCCVPVLEFALLPVLSLDLLEPAGVFDVLELDFWSLFESFFSFFASPPDVWEAELGDPLEESA